MSRRRRGGWFARLTRSLGSAAGAVRHLVQVVVLFPVRVFFEIWNTLGAMVSAGLEGRGGVDAFVYFLTFIPRLVWYYVVTFAVALFHFVLSWPRLMRLRDLAAGLPALAAAIAALLILFVFDKKDVEILSMYEEAVKTSFDEAQSATDPDVRKAALERALLYRRAGAKLNEAEVVYKFDIARLYLELGEIERGSAMMQTLAPRETAGFAPAHLWQAGRLETSENPTDWFDNAVAHLTWALQTSGAKAEIHKRLGDVNFRYYNEVVRLNPNRFDPRRPAPQMILKAAEEHYLAAGAEDRDIRAKLGFVYAYQGRREEANRLVTLVANSFMHDIAVNPGDKVTRLQLVRLLRDTFIFDAAKRYLIEGRNLKADSEYDYQLASVCVSAAIYKRSMNSQDIASYHQELREAYVAYPYFPNAIGLWFLSLLEQGEESNAARKELQGLLNLPGVNPAIAHFLLAFDAERRRYPREAQQHYAAARSTKEEMVPKVLADVARAVSERAGSANNSALGSQFAGAVLQNWPEQPGVLTTIGLLEMRKGNYAGALAQFNKALVHQQNDATLHLYLSQTYQALGQNDNAAKHRRLMEAARASLAREAQPPVAESSSATR